jgi:hypothetical protein
VPSGTLRHVWGTCGSTHQLGVHDPLPAVHKFSDDIEVTGVTRGFRNDVKNNFPEGVESPIAELLSRPPQWLGVERNGVNDLIRPSGLFQISSRGSLNRTHLRSPARLQRLWQVLRSCVGRQPPLPRTRIDRRPMSGAGRARESSNPRAVRTSAGPLPRVHRGFRGQDGAEHQGA